MLAFKKINACCRKFLWLCYHDFFFGDDFDSGGFDSFDFDSGGFDSFDFDSGGFDSVGFVSGAFGDDDFASDVFGDDDFASDGFDAAGFVSGNFGAGGFSSGVLGRGGFAAVVLTAGGFGADESAAGVLGAGDAAVAVLAGGVAAGFESGALAAGGVFSRMCTSLDLSLTWKAQMSHSRRALSAFSACGDGFTRLQSLCSKTQAPTTLTGHVCNSTKCSAKKQICCSLETQLCD